MYLSIRNVCFALVVAAAALFVPERGHSRAIAPLLPAPTVRAAAIPAKPVRAAIAPAPQTDFDTESRMNRPQLMRRWDPFIAAASKRFEVPAAWIRAVMQIESGGRTMLGPNQPMLSSMGAMGVMQLMPSTYADMRAEYRLGSNPYDPHDNILAGAAYLRWLYGKYGYPEMFAAYNDGPGNLAQRLLDGGLLPEETRNYLGIITGRLENGGVGGGRGGLRFTRPNGEPVMVAAAGGVVSVRAAFDGEYAPGVQTVITVGRLHQGVRESVARVTAVIRAHGGIVSASTSPDRFNLIAAKRSGRKLQP